MVVAILYDYFFQPQRIRGIYSIPGELPVVGHLHLSLHNPAKAYMEWASRYNKSVYQIRLGTRWVVVVNSYDAVVDIWMNHSCQNNSRPVSYTFHGLIGSYHSFTVGSTPQSITYRRKKRAISQLLHTKSISSRESFICEEIEFILHEIREVANDTDVDLTNYLKYFALRCSVFLTYGIHLDCFGKDNALCNEIISNESNIIRLRSPISNFQDSIPLLKHFPSLTNARLASQCGYKREMYMSELYHRFQDGFRDGHEDNISSFVGQLLAESSVNQLNEAEIYSICLTFISAGLDNTPLNLNYLLGILSQPEVGWSYQSKAVNEILANSRGDSTRAWEQSNGSDLRNAYVHALILETLRQFTVLPLSLPRTITRDILYENVKIPAGTQLFMNAYAANHDATHFVAPFEFRPERWIDENGHISFTAKAYQHFAFGAGSRMCSGYSFALKEMYIFMVKILLMFEVHPPDSNLMITDPFVSNGNPRATSFEPLGHNIKLSLRQFPNSERPHDMALII
ncbi:hypothetical protein CANMA_002629 [Candida margitis]|uniref:uncharacterized protein n=1 Tax=Candida margitis TaxID=1775924 RepID=UPI0022264164|nr:uncharacterized protein CANMA_002629 [Candida margitis]KAI5967861.1 hypothetical protein CANMA_002629 [Candida margitis]